jgi:hypothetical protein
MVHELRNEFIHYYPRHVPTASRTPDWLKGLAEKGLLVKLPPEMGDFGWHTKLRSSRLAFWCAGVIVSSAEQFAMALQGLKGGGGSMLALDVRQYAQTFRQLLVDGPKER